MRTALVRVASGAFAYQAIAPGLGTRYGALGSLAFHEESAELLDRRGLAPASIMRRDRPAVTAHCYGG